MAEHEAQKLEVARQMGHEPNDVYGEPQAPATEKKPQGFQEEIATVEELLSEIPAMDEALPDETMAPEEAPKSDIDDLVARLQAVAGAEDVSEEDKTSAEEMAARLEELKAAKVNAQEFLTEKEKAPEAPAEEGVEVVAVAEEGVV